MDKRTCHHYARKIMMLHLGRKLKKGECVHHIDGDYRNNDINNLYLFKSTGEHNKYHGMLNNFVREELKIPLDGQKRWSIKNIERIKKYHQKGYKENREHILKVNKKWREKNKEKISIKSKQYYFQNRNKILKRQKEQKERKKRIQNEQTNQG